MPPSPEGVSAGDGTLLAQLHPLPRGSVAVAAGEGTQVGNEAGGEQYITGEVDVVQTQVMGNL